MSQQMHENYEGYQPVYTPPANDSRDFVDRQPFSVSPGQKIGSSHFPKTASSSKQSLPLAIVSVVMLVPLAAILLGNPTLGVFALVTRVIAMGLVCLALIGINIAFNFKR